MEAQASLAMTWVRTSFSSPCCFVFKLERHVPGTPGALTGDPESGRILPKVLWGTEEGDYSILKSIYEYLPNLGGGFLTKALAQCRELLL